MSSVFSNDITYQPKGSMCCNCTHWSRDCSRLPFETMPVIEKVGNVRVVKCHEFSKPLDTKEINHHEL